MNVATAALVLALSAPAGGKAPLRPSSGTAATTAGLSSGTAAGAKTGTAGRAAPVPPTHVQAAMADYLYKERRTILTGQPLVTFTREDATLVCRKAVAENDAQGEIQHATCEGDVKLTRGDRIVTCARATFEAASGKVVCRGDPVLRDGASVLHCEEVVYDLDQDRVSAKQVKGTLVQRPGEKPPVRGRAP